MAAVTECVSYSVSSREFLLTPSLLHLPQHHRPPVPDRNGRHLVFTFILFRRSTSLVVLHSQTRPYNLHFLYLPILVFFLLRPLASLSLLYLPLRRRDARALLPCPYSRSCSKSSAVVSLSAFGFPSVPCHDRPCVAKRRSLLAPREGFPNRKSTESHLSPNRSSARFVADPSHQDTPPAPSI